ncbi:hypothetical protein [Chryseosolibacter indicus]|uniref:DUF3052 domain-containing protein n=1 Tax=Chryseosolibacter indicus TaxID=2782351 RepID=A0ABS5VMC7_9BACT|nr:hypothetical protein [Chryseosolibacter indicus]MBT1702603.1 hypothetical protein [Chryseosolibacter indicus]
MNAIFKKLNFKDQKQIFILNAPESFMPPLKEMESDTEIKVSLKPAETIEFVLAFVTKQNEVDMLAEKIARQISVDGIVWFAYPKGTSKKYKCEFNRDTGWTELGKHGFEGVRMVAIDEDWSALRFRKAEHIKKMTRSFAMSEQGKKKTQLRSAVKRSKGKKP